MVCGGDGGDGGDWSQHICSHAMVSSVYRAPFTCLHTYTHIYKHLHTNTKTHS